jgi:Kef-type K+ transport system membrane component KefB
MGFMDPYLLLTLLFASAAVLAWMARRVGLSYVAGYTIAGVAVGLLAPGVSEGYATLLGVFSDVAMALLAFEAGREVGLEGVKRLGAIPLMIVLGEVVVSLTLMTVAGLILGLSLVDVAVLTLMASCCSTTIAYKLMHERGLDPDMRRLVLSVSAADDVVGIALLALLPQLSRGYVSLLDALTSTASSLTTAAALVVAGATLVRSLFARVVRPDEFGLATAISLSFAYALIARAAGLSPALGAFAAGLALSAHPEADKIGELMRSVREMFLIVFFVMMGLNASAAATSPPSLAASLMIGALIVLARLVAFSSSAWLVSGYGLEGALEMSFFAMTVSEFSLIAAYEAVRLGAATWPMVTIAALSTIAATMASSALTKDFKRCAGRLSSMVPASIRLLGDRASSYLSKALEGEVSRVARDTFMRLVRESASMVIVAFAASSMLYAADALLSQPYSSMLAAVVIAAAALAVFKIVQRVRLHADALYQALTRKSGASDPSVRRLLSGLTSVGLTALTALLATLTASKYVEAAVDRLLGLGAGRLAAASAIIGLLALALWSVVSRLRRLASAIGGKGA